jgi:signal transduction histidine kinase
VKIGQRLALRFTLVSALLTGAILVFIYTVTRGFVHSDFIGRLSQQSSLEVLHYATPHVRDVIPSGSFLLVNPEISIYSAEGELLHSKGNFLIPDTWLTYLKSHDVFNAERGDYTTVGRKYTVEGKAYLVFVSDKDLPGQHELDILLKAVAIGWMLSLLLSYLAGLYFASNALEPVKQVVKEVNQVTKDNLGYRLSISRELTNPDEIEELILTFNALLERIESAFIAQKRFVQHASHELKTPLTAILAEAELALTKDRSSDEYKRTLSSVVSETERLVSITQGLLMLARLEEGYFGDNLEEMDLNRVLQSTIQSLKITYPEREIVVSGHLNDPMLTGNNQLLQIVLTNLLDNALKYSSKEVLVDLSEDDHHRLIRVIDRGIGIPEHELPKIRSAMFRASNAGNFSGAGLGLSLVQRILDAYGGSLEIQSKPDLGTSCILKLPSIVKKN